MKPFHATVALLALAVGTAFAQPEAGVAQPNRINFGMVYTGATVEASFLLFVPGNDPDVPLAVVAPRFVKVLSKGTHVQRIGDPGKNFVGGTVEFALDTSAAGEMSGEVIATLGQTTARIPVSATVERRRPGLTRLLIVESPFDCYSTGDGNVFKAWTDLVQDAAADTSYLLVADGRPVLRDLDLSHFDCVLLGEQGLTQLSPADVSKVRAFVEAGGRAVVAADAFFVGTVKQANVVLDGYGLQMRDEQARDADQGEVTMHKGDLRPEVTSAGVRSLRFVRASPVAVTDATKGKVLVSAIGVGRPGDAFVAIGKAGKGQVIALGQSLWWLWISKQQSAHADNARLLRWLLRPGRP